MNMQKNTAEEAFFKLIRLAIGSCKDGHVELEAEDWNRIYELAQKQALAAIVLDGVTCLPVSEKPPMDLVLKWIGLVQKIEMQNRRLNKLVVMVADKFRQEQMGCILLKGQGLASLYPKPLHRMPGDIDLWMTDDRRRLVKYVRQRCPGVEVVYHHIDFPVLKDVELELHFTPSWMNCWRRNRKLQRIFKEWLPMQLIHQIKLPEVVGTVAVPTLEMNRIYVLLHIYRHLFDEGIGLRQLLDYYFILVQPCTESERQTAVRQLKQLGMYRFARAVMYVEQEVFGLDEEHLLVQPSEFYGRRLLEEIMLAGNFGQYDLRIKRQKDETHWHKFNRKVTRNFHFLTDYPEEVIWSPLFKMWHYQWRKRNGYFAGETGK